MLFCLWSDVWGCLISCLTMFFLRREDVVKCTPYSCLFVSPNDSKPFIAAGLKILKRPLGDGTNSSCQLSGHTQNKIQTPWSKIWPGLLNCHRMNIPFHSCCFSSVTTNSGPRLHPFHPVFSCSLLLFTVHFFGWLSPTCTPLPPLLPASSLLHLHLTFHTHVLCLPSTDFLFFFSPEHTSTSPSFLWTAPCSHYTSQCHLQTSKFTETPA